MFGALARKLFGTANERFVKSLRPLVDQINALEPEISALSDDALRAQTELFRARLQSGATLDEILPEAFATVREAAKRVLNMRHFDVQLIGGMALHKGMISEMRTGEGKTLVATLACYLNAIEGKGVHVVTVNDYLASRDAEWMGAIYNFLGLTVSCIIHGLEDDERKAAYAADITYGTNNEFGFDFLRDNLKFSRESMVQRAFNFAIVDEVDSILVDEARTPLIISGPAEDSSALYVQINQLIPQLPEIEYEKDEKSRTVTLTDDGVHTMEQLLEKAGLIAEGASLYDIENVSIVHHVNQALRAHMLFTRDVDYIVKDNKVIIIDEFTGRMMEGRRYSDGLHQALEAKENAHIQNENQTLASITFQNYFRMYPKLAGMTGTAMTEAGEFREIYGLEVIEIPTHRPISRRDEDDEVYRTANEKYKAVLLQIAECYKRKQPVLVGTVSIEKSEFLSATLSNKKFFKEVANECQTLAKKLREQAEKAGEGKKREELEAAATEQKEKGDYLLSLAGKEVPIPHQVLNARHHEKEASIIAQAGRPYAVTIATNMAGRGTDITLGGNADMRIREELADLEPEHKDYAKKADKIRAEVEAAKQEVLEAGGLYVLGTERHESRRIDNQLRGRSGRQGDPGASKFYLSLEDDLLRIFGAERVDTLLQRMGLQEGEAIFHPWMNKALEKAQQKVEARNFDMRKNLLKFDDVMNDQRKVIYEQRIELMEAEDVSETITGMREEVIEALVSRFIPAKSYPEQWEAETLEHEVFHLFGLHLPVQDWAKEEGIADQEIRERLTGAVGELFAAKEAAFSANIMRIVEKRVLLQTLDHLWKEHLLALDHLRQGINLRAYGQRDPLNEYKQEAFSLFEGLLTRLREEVVKLVAHLQIHVGDSDEDVAELGMIRRNQEMHETRVDPALGEEGYAEPKTSATITPLRTTTRPEDRNPNDPSTWGKVARNEECPCGSGKKYKHCHGAV